MGELQTMEQSMVSWENSPFSFLQNLRGVLFENDLCDVTLISDDQKLLKSHKLILSACSPVFKTIIQNSNHSYPVIYLRGIRFQDIEAIVKFIYSGEASIPQSNLKSFLTVVEDLQIKDLVYETPNLVEASSNEIIEESVQKTTSNSSSDSAGSKENEKMKILHSTLNMNPLRESSGNCWKRSSVNKLIDKSKPTEEMDQGQKNKIEETILSEPIGERWKTLEFSNTEEKILEAFLEEREKNVQEINVCEICNSKLGSKEEYMTHKNTVHLMCDICDQIYSSLNSLKIHKKFTKFTHKKRFQCSKCGYKSNSKEKNRIHYKAIHANVQYKCDILPNVSNDSSNARRHKRLMNSSVRYPCTECSYKGGTSDSLKKHINSHHANKLP